jgi:tetratricopeptide (TPR) repeat protein
LQDYNRRREGRVVFKTAAFLLEIGMRKTRLVVVFGLLGASAFLQLAHTRAMQQDTPVLDNAPPDLLALQLSDARRLDLEEALNRRNWKKAETILVEEVDSDPKSRRAAKLLVLAGGVFFLDGQYLNAAISWKKSEAIVPLDDRSRFTLAMAYVKLNRRDWARPELEKLSAAQPQNALFPYWLARLDYDARKFASAISTLQKVIELDPKMMRAYDLLGLCYDHQGQPAEALNNYSRAVELTQNQTKPSPWPHVDLAILLISLNRLSEAEQHLREAIKYDSNLPQAHYELGQVLDKQGRYEEAIPSLERALSLDPSYPEPHYLLSRIYHRLGNDRLSKSEIERFQELKKAGEAQFAGHSPSAPD